MSDKWDEVMERERRRAVPDGRQTPHGGENEAALPGLDDPYKAVSHVSNGHEEVLCCVMGRAEYDSGGEVYRFFEYVHKASDTGLAFAKDGSHVLRLRFVGPESVTIIVKGRNLLRACHQIQRHRIGWIRLFDPERNFPRLEVEGGKKTEVITSIEVIHDDPRHKPGS